MPEYPFATSGGGLGSYNIDFQGLVDKSLLIYDAALHAFTVTDGSLTLPKTTNQLILGTTKTITLTAPTPAASRVYTIPDIGSAGSFVISPPANAQGDIVFYGSASWDKLSIGAANSYLKSQGAGADPVWAAVVAAGTINSGTAGNLTLYPDSDTTVGDLYVQNGNNINIAIGQHTLLL